MKTYLISRLHDASEEDSREVVGVIRANDPLELFEYMDEVGNPNDFEYLRVHAGTPGGFVRKQAVGWYQNADEESKWRTFTDLVGGDFDRWYAETYVPSLPTPE